MRIGQELQRPAYLLGVGAVADRDAAAHDAEIEVHPGVVGDRVRDRRIPKPIEFRGDGGGFELEALRDELLLQAFVLLRHLGATPARRQDSETNPRMSVTIRSMASPPNVPSAIDNSYPSNRSRAFCKKGSLAGTRGSRVQKNDSDSHLRSSMRAASASSWIAAMSSVRKQTALPQPASNALSTSIGSRTR